MSQRLAPTTHDKGAEPILDTATQASRFQHLFTLELWEDPGDELRLLSDPDALVLVLHPPERRTCTVDDNL